jgi:hypothetical protein
LGESILTAADPQVRTGPNAWAQVPLLLWLVTLALVAGGLAILLETRDLLLPPAWGFRGFAMVPALAYGTVGALVTTRRAENLVGWILLAAGLGAAILFFGSEYATYGLVAHPGALPGAALAAWVVSWIWLPFSLLVGPVFFLVFPDGHLKSPRWRLLLWLSIASLGFMAVAVALTPGPLVNFSYLDNPFGVPAVADLAPVIPLFLGLLGLIFVGGASSLALRLREAHGDERQQLKWVAYAALFAGASAPLGNFGKPFELLFIVAFSTVPLAAAIAILRYRLYDIDLLINRTLVYGSLTAVLAGVYTASIALMQRLFVALTGERSDAAIVATTLVVVVAFTPIKNRLQTLVDRRFKEPRDPAALLARFVEGLSEGPWVVDPLRARERFAGAAESAFDATGAGLYIGSAEAPAFATPGWTGDVALSVPLGRVGRQDAELRLGPRAEDRPYATEDVTILRNAATAVTAAAGSHSG